jgi:hypothetical protein
VLAASADLTSVRITRGAVRLAAATGPPPATPRGIDIGPLPGRQPESGLVLPILDVDVAIAELEWAANAGLKGALLPYGNSIDKALYDSSLDRFSSAAESLNMPVHIHSGCR